MIQASCNCGAVRFEVAAPTDVYVCHCSICRRYTGAGNIAVVVVPNDSFRWLSGEDSITRWQHPDADWQSTFCRICGSALPGANDPERMYIPAGLLGAMPEAQVAHHIFVGSKAHWEVIGADGGQQHDGHIGETGGAAG